MGFAPQQAQHHEHQLVPFWALRPNRPSIMSISWFRFRFCTPQQAQHHEHRLVAFWALRPNRPSIMSISSLRFGLCAPADPASSTLAGSVWAVRPNRRSIMSISWLRCGLCAPTGPASLASAGSVFGLFVELAQHHEHQPVPCWALRPHKPSIISISWFHFGLCAPTGPAS